MHSYIVDYESLYHKSFGTQLIQEFAYYDIEQNIFYNFFIKLPLKFDYNKCWYQIKNINFIPIDYGETSFETVINFLNQDAKFYVKGKIKVNYLKSLTNKQIINLDDINCPNYSLLEFNCDNHNCEFISHTNKHKNCALNKVINISNWFKKHESNY